MNIIIHTNNFKIELFLNKKFIKIKLYLNQDEAIGITKTLWNIKELRKYSNQLNSKITPNYDLKNVSEINKEIVEIITEYWDFIHPIIQDYIWSFIHIMTNSNQKINHLDSEINKLNSEINTLNNEINSISNKLEEKSSIYDKYKAQVEEEIINLKAKLEKQDETITELQGKLYETTAEKKKLSDLKQDLELKVKDLEKIHETVGESFHLKIMEMDSKIDTKDELIENLNNDLNQKLSIIEENRVEIHKLKSEIEELNTKLSQIKSLPKRESVDIKPLESQTDNIAFELLRKQLITEDEDEVLIEKENPIKTEDEEKMIFVEDEYKENKKNHEEW